MAEPWPTESPLRQDFREALCMLEELICHHIATVGPQRFPASMGGVLDMIVDADASATHWSLQSLLWDMHQLYYKAELMTAPPSYERPTNDLVPALPRQVLLSIKELPPLCDDELQTPWSLCVRFAGRLYDTVRLAGGLPARSILLILKEHDVYKDGLYDDKGRVGNPGQNLKREPGDMDLDLDLDLGRLQPADSDAILFPDSDEQAQAKDDPDKLEKQALRDALDRSEARRKSLHDRNLKLAKELARAQQRIDRQVVLYKWSSSSLSLQ